MTTPIVATSIDDFPTERSSLMLSSSPTSSSSRITPSSARTVEDLVGVEQAEDRRADDDPGDDLTDDGRDADPLRDLRGDLRRQEDDDDVDEDLGDAAGVGGQDHGLAVTADSSAVTRCMR